MVARCGRVAARAVDAFECGFFALGRAVALRPATTVVACLAAAALALVALPLVGLDRETDPLRLWVPPSSRFARDTAWLASRVGAVARPQRVMVVARDRDSLSPNDVAALAELHARLAKLDYGDVCLRVPDVSSLPTVATRKRRGAFDDEFFGANSSADEFGGGVDGAEFDPSVQLEPGAYCALLESLPLACWSEEPAELWRFDAATIRALSPNEMIATLASSAISERTGHRVSYRSAIGGARLGANGEPRAAKALLSTWYATANLSDGGGGNDAGTEMFASDAALEYESAFLEVVGAFARERDDVDVRYESSRSLGDVSDELVRQDVGKLVVGVALMFAYVQCVLSKRSWVEARFALGSVGLLCVGMALVVSHLLCSLCGASFGPIHKSLPFLLMGLGIDDMFVMKAAWEQLPASERGAALEDRVGSMLRHAGVSIAVTSFTDVTAFLVGSITILPSLQSFCVYAAVGVLFIFVFAVTFYVGVFVLDAKRIEAKRNGVLFCVRHPSHEPSDDTKRPPSQVALHWLYSTCVLTTPAKFVVLLFVAVVFGFSLDGTLRLEQRFDPSWFVPESSSYAKYLRAQREYYPEMGHEGAVFLGALNYTKELPKIYGVVRQLRNETDVVYDLDSWTDTFSVYVRKNFGKNVERASLSDAEWSTYLSKFLFSPSGSKYRMKFRFSSELVCGQPAPSVIVSSLDFKFKLFPGPDVYIPAKYRVLNIIDGANFTTGDKFATVWAKIFANWETDEVIYFEVRRNLEIALVCVMICTFVFILNFYMCFWIFVCVLLTLVNVCGWMYHWGLTVDIISCVGLELGIGFCVDYAAHIGHTFLTIRGNRNERALKTVTSIGAAVLYGGGSTLLALSVLSVSESYVFKTFFKIFLLVILFGLFNGVVFLPVVLSIIGPRPYEKEIKKEDLTNNVDELRNLQSEVVNLNSL